MGVQKPERCTTRCCMLLSGLLVNWPICAISLCLNYPQLTRCGGRPTARCTSQGVSSLRYPGVRPVGDHHSIYLKGFGWMTRATAVQVAASLAGAVAEVQRQETREAGRR
jgi:hypothetical protein